MNRTLKGTFKSLTIWFNTICLSLMAGWPFLTDSLPALAQYLTPDQYKNLGFLVIVGNIALRFRTSKPLDQK